MEPMLDAYQQAVEYLTEHPNLIYIAWAHGHDPATTMHNLPYEVGVGYVLFAGVGSNCGCLTQVRAGSKAATVQLEQAVRFDRRIPFCGEDIKVDDLPIFAGWQRRIDAILGRTPPPLDPRLPMPKGDIPIPAIELELQPVS